MPQPTALKPPSTARTAGRSDWAERRLRHQPFILLFVTASSIPLISAEKGENSLIPLRLLFPPNPLRWASAGALLFSDNRLICPKYAEGAPHTARGKPFPKRFQITLAQTPQRSFQGTAAGIHATPSPNRAHSGSHGETRGALDGGAITTLGPFCAVRNLCARRGQDGCTLLFLYGSKEHWKKQRAFGTETRTGRVAVPQALRVLREHIRPRPKSGKVCRSDTRPRRVSEPRKTVQG